MPIMICAVDSPERIASAVDAIEGMLEDGLLVVSDVEMVRLVRSGLMEVSHAAESPR